MGIQNSEMWIGSREDTAQHRRESAQRNRDRAQQLRELAVTMTSDEDRKDIQWLAERYDRLAKGAELLENSGRATPTDAVRLSAFDAQKDNQPTAEFSSAAEILR